jgi:hypothetical protein
MFSFRRLCCPVARAAAEIAWRIFNFPLQFGHCSKVWLRAGCRYYWLHAARSHDNGRLTFVELHGLF